MVEIIGVSKKYKNILAIDDVSFRIPDGVYGLIGENGAGKSTLLKILVTLENFDSGMIKIFGHDLKLEQKKIRKLIGYLPQQFEFFSNITVYEAMSYLAVLKSVHKSEMDSEIKKWLSLVHLTKEKSIKIKNLSGGMKQRLGIAQAFLGNPRLIVLDEPTVGLDPKERLAFRNLVNEMSEGKTIIISTHIVSDVSSSCENLGVLQQGKILINGTVDNFTKSVDRKIYHILAEKEEVPQIMEYGNIISIKRVGKKIEVRYFAPPQEKEDYLKRSVEADCTVEDAYFYHAQMWLKKEELL